jgi:hypothetical protein
MRAVVVGRQVGATVDLDAVLAGGKEGDDGGTGAEGAEAEEAEEEEEEEEEEYI